MGDILPGDGLGIFGKIFCKDLIKREDTYVTTLLVINAYNYMNMS